MVRINTSSIFQTVDLDDAASIRRIMEALHYLLTNTVLYSAAPELKAIEVEGRQQENSVAQIILSRIRMMPNHLLLLKATLRFVEARDGTDQQVLIAAKELETLATEEVLTIPQAHPAAYVVAEALFSSRPREVSKYMPIYMFNRSLEEKAPGAFVGMQIFSSHAGVKLDETKTREDTKAGIRKTLSTQETGLELRIRESLSKPM